LNRETARKYALRAISTERRRQLDRFPERSDDSQSKADVLDIAGILSAYNGVVGDQGMTQRDGIKVDYVALARALVKIGAVAQAFIESLLSLGHVSAADLKEEE